MVRVVLKNQLQLWDRHSFNDVKLALPYSTTIFFCMRLRHTTIDRCPLSQENKVHSKHVVCIGWQQWSVFWPYNQICSSFNYCGIFVQPHVWGDSMFSQCPQQQQWFMVVVDIMQLSNPYSRSIHEWSACITSGIANIFRHYPTV